MPNTTRPTFVAYDAKDPDSEFPPIEQLRLPKGAPNVLVILIDDAAENSDHLVSPEETIRVAMARQ